MSSVGTQLVNQNRYQGGPGTGELVASEIDANYGGIGLHEMKATDERDATLAAIEELKYKFGLMHRQGINPADQTGGSPYDNFTESDFNALLQRESAKFDRGIELASRQDGNFQSFDFDPAAFRMENADVSRQRFANAADRAASLEAPRMSQASVSNVAQMAPGSLAEATMLGQASQAGGPELSFQNQMREGTLGLADAVAQRAYGQGGPSPAQTMLDQARQRNNQEAMSIARSADGLGAVAAQRLAVQSAERNNQQAASQMSLLRAQEQIAAQNQLGGIYSQARGQDLSAAQLGLGASQFDTSAANQFALTDTAALNQFALREGDYSQQANQQNAAALNAMAVQNANYLQDARRQNLGSALSTNQLSLGAELDATKGFANIDSLDTANRIAEQGLMADSLQGAQGLTAEFINTNKAIAAGKQDTSVQQIGAVLQGLGGVAAGFGALGSKGATGATGGATTSREYFDGRSAGGNAVNQESNPYAPSYTPTRPGFSPPPSDTRPVAPDRGRLPLSRPSTGSGGAVPLARGGMSLSEAATLDRSNAMNRSKGRI